MSGYSPRLPVAQILLVLLILVSVLTASLVTALVVVLAIVSFIAYRLRKVRLERQRAGRLFSLVRRRVRE